MVPVSAHLVGLVCRCTFTPRFSMFSRTTARHSSSNLPGRERFGEEGSSKKDTRTNRHSSSNLPGSEGPVRKDPLREDHVWEDQGRIA